METRSRMPIKSTPEPADGIRLSRAVRREREGGGLRFRGRIEQVLDAAKAQGHRTGENPARWRGHLDKLLAKRQRLTRGHHAAMAYA
jgi:hypothetical protein